MKKLLSTALACFILLSLLTLSVSAAEKLPFELTPPENVFVFRGEDIGDSPTTHTLSYSLSDDMLGFFDKLDKATDKEAFLKKYGYTDIYLNLQFDWALDDVNDSVSGWHYNDFWKYNSYFGTFGVDNDGNRRTSEWDGCDLWALGNLDTVQTLWITRGVPDDDRWNGNPDTKTPGVKEQLRSSQYSYHDDTVWIDWTQHTLYVRARFVLNAIKENSESFETIGISDWSQTAAAGKDGVKFTVLTAKDLPAPEIKELHMTDETFNGNPVVAFTLTVPEDLAYKASQIAAMRGGISVETYARVKGDTEWTEMQNTDHSVKTGELTCALLHLVNDQRPTIPADTQIELRCRYRCYQQGQDDIWSDYSRVISFGTDDINTYGSTTTGAVPAGSADKCPICHFCPRPLGICIFIWLLIIIIIVVVIIIIASKNKKKKKEEK